MDEKELELLQHDKIEEHKDDPEGVAKDEVGDLPPAYVATVPILVVVDEHGYEGDEFQGEASH